MSSFPRISNDSPKQQPSPLGRVEQLEDRITPVLVAVGDVYLAGLGRLITVPANEGILSNDFSNTNPGQVLTAALVGAPRFVGGTAPLPAVPPGSLFLSPDGSFRFFAPQFVPQFGIEQIQFTYQVSNGVDLPATGVVTINLQANPTNLFAVGADAPGGPHVRVYQSGTGELKLNFFPYEQSFTGGVRTATGDLNDDGIDDIVTIPATGGSARIRVYDGRDGAPLVDQFVFDPAFRGGGYVAIGDINGNGRNDIIVGAGEGGGPRVSVFEFNPINNALTQTADFFAYESNSQMGVRVASGNLNSQGRDSIITAPGVGGSPLVKVFDGQQVIGRPVAQPVFSFFAGDSTTRSGVNIAAGDFSGNGVDDILTGSGSGAGQVRIYSGQNGGLLRTVDIPNQENPVGTSVFGGPGTFDGTGIQQGTLLSPGLTPGSLIPTASFSGGLPTPGLFGNLALGGIRVAATDFNNDGLEDFVIGSGPGSTPRVRVLNNSNGQELTSILAFSNTFLGGVNVSAG